MTITRCALQNDSSRSGSVKGDPFFGTREFSRTYHLWASSEDDDENTIIDYFRTNRPFIGDSHPTWPLAVCKEISPQYVGGGGAAGWKWTVRVSYDSTVGQPSTGRDEDGNETTDPEKWIEIDVGGYTDTVAVWSAIYRSGIDDPDVRPGTSIVPINAAGEVFDPPLEKEILIGTLTVTRWTKVWNANTYRQLVNSVNDDFVAIANFAYFDSWKEFTAKIKSITGSYDFKNEAYYWKRTTEVHIHPETWRAVVPNIGTVARAKAGDPNGRGGIISPSEEVTGVPQVRKLLDVNGKSVQGKMLLDAKGQPLKNQNGQPTWITYSIYPETSFMPKMQEGLIL